MMSIVLLSAGGLVTAVAPVVVDCQGLWLTTVLSPITSLSPARATWRPPPASGPQTSSPSIWNPSKCSTATTTAAAMQPSGRSMPDKAVFNIETETETVYAKIPIWVMSIPEESEVNQEMT